ncbi:unnamed protein product [Staurois parvus]|uniref:Uncharacterized protein n=1 Tax=Staurois parvus TaxID=386267 RepID=A0ABN9D887_9NEOB|nr:unnamed protein product [Staurois parvus]
MLSLFSIARESACDQHRLKLHCPDRVHRFCILIEQKENSSYKF